MTTQLGVFLFTDLVGSVAVKQRVDPETYVTLLARHGEIFRDSLSRAGGTVLQDTGDGFYARLPTASDAARASILFQRRMAEEDWHPERLHARIGIHLGEVIETSEELAGETSKLVGTPIDVAARVMGLAGGDQILMTRAAFDNARAHVRGDEAHGIRWIAHGSYLLKGMEEPVEIFEVGEDGIARLETPPDTEKAKREVSAREEEVLGWRPAMGLEIPGRAGWQVESSLGRGGFGEVWVARHAKTKERHVFKFCFQADRLRSFKRELTLFRVLREVLGERDDIARLHEVRLDEAPFFVESEYAELGNLLEWAESQGGIANVAMETRIDLVARTARAVAAAHSVGVIHKDLKPSNILVYEGHDGRPRPRLADFGIGLLTDRSQLPGMGITETGLTETLVAGNESSRTGTRMYAPPESQRGEVATVQGDVYALGVILFQVVVGDLERPIGTGWRRAVADDLLCADIRACVEAEPAYRLSSAQALANRLERLRARRSRERAVLFAGIVASFLIGALVYLRLAQAERDRQAIAAAKRAEEAARAVESSLEASMEVLYSFRALYAASESVTREEFATFAQGPLDRHPGLSFLAWTPRVQAADRAEFVRRARLEGFPDFEIRSGVDDSVGSRDLHFPILFVAPSRSDMLGIDTTALDADLAALIWAEAIGLVVCRYKAGGTAPFARSGPALIAWAPILGGADSGRSPDGRSGRVEGCPFALIDLNGLLEGLRSEFGFDVEVSHESERRSRSGDAFVRIHVAGESFEVSVRSRSSDGGMFRADLAGIATALILGTLVAWWIRSRRRSRRYFD